MKTLFRMVLVSGTLAGLLGLVTLLGAETWSGLADWHAVVDFYGQLETQVRLETELERDKEITWKEIRARDAVVRDLIEGRTTLLSAAACFRRLAETSGRPNPLYLFPGQTDTDRYCRQVIVWVEGRLENDRPDRRQALMNLLEKELKANSDRRAGAQVPEL
jgi:hypothetical protein